VIVYRETYENNRLIEREKISEDIYKPVQGLKRVGPYDSNDTEGGEETVKEEAMEEQNYIKKRDGLMLDSLYNKSVVCPVCQNKIEVTKVKSKDCVVASRDSDFCVYYESVNPLFYEVWVCEHCGYAALQERFENISPIEAKIVKENISKYWKPRSFCGERDVDKAIEAFKLALYNLCKISPKPIEYAKVCLRIAWLYRMKKR